MSDRRRGAGLLLAVSGAVLGWAVSVYAAGEVLWQTVDTPRAGKQEAVAAAVDGAGAVIVTGYTESTGTDLLTVKFKADGSGIHWRATAGAPSVSDQATAVAVDGNGDVLVVGYVRNGTDDDLYTVKYAGATGAVLWAHSFDPSGTGNDRATAVAVDALNNVYVGGYSPSSGATPKDDFYLLKYGPGGPVADQPLWKLRYDGGFTETDRITDLWVGEALDGNTYVAVTGLSQNTTNTDGLTMKFDSNGVFKWQRRFGFDGGLTTTNDSALVVRMDFAGNVIVGGYRNNGSNRDLYVAKYLAADGAVAWEKPLDNGFHEEITDLWVDSLGDVYVTGYRDTSLGGSSDLYVARHAASDGTRVWSDLRDTLSGNVDKGVGIAVDEFGEVFVTGSMFVSSTARYDFVTLKYKKSNGTRLWDPPAYYGGVAGENDRPVWIGQDAAGDLLVAGWTDTWTAGATDYDYVVVKYDPGVPNAPTSLVATAVSDSEISLVWTDNSSAPNEEYFAIDRKVGAGAWVEAVATVPADTTTYTDPGLAANVLYTYRVRGYTAADGYSYASNEASAKTTVITYQSPLWSVVKDYGVLDEATAVAVGPDGNPVVTGYTLHPTNSFDYYTLKLNRAVNGAELWSVRYDGQGGVDMPVDVEVDPTNRVVVAGTSFLYVPVAGNTNDLWTMGYPATGPTGPSQPNWSWGAQYNGPTGADGASGAVAAATDASGNVAVVGYGKNAAGNDDIYVLKYAPDGTRLWAAIPFNGGAGGLDHPSAVAIAPAGDVVVAGYTYDGAGFDYFVAKYASATGARSWTALLGGPGSGDYGNDYAEAVAVDAAGDVYVTGTVVSSRGDTDIRTVKLRATTGAQLWSAVLDGPASGDDRGVGIGIDPIDGQVIVAGSRLVAAGQADFSVTRYAAATGGTPLWDRLFERPQDDELWAAVFDASGNVSLAGQTVDSGSDLDMLTAKVDYQGNVVAATVYDGPGGLDDVAMSVAVNRYGESIVAGYTTNVGGNTDYAIFTSGDPGLQVVTPLSVAPGFAQAVLTWSDNSLNNDGYTVERKAGACATAGTWSVVTTTGPNVETYTDPGLSSGGTTYCYRVQAYKSSGDTSRWVEVETTTRVATAPTDLTAVAYSTTDIDLAWTDTSGGEAAWQILRCEGSASCTPTVEVAAVPAGTASYRDPTLQDGVLYRYRINGLGAGWSTGVSNVAGATTPTPVAPINLSVTQTNEKRLALVWSGGTPDPGAAFVIQRCLGAGCSDWGDLASTSALTYDDTTVLPTATYRYRVLARKTTTWHSWETAPTNAFEITSTVAAPTLTTMSVMNTTQVRIYWSDSITYNTGFEVERCAGTLAECEAVPNFTAVATTPNTTSYLDTSVAQGQTYTYRVRGVGTTPALWYTEYSAGKELSTPAAVPLSGFSVVAVSQNEVKIDWTDGNTDEEGFRVWRCQGAGCTSGYVQVGGALPPTTTGTYSDTSVVIGNTYGYFVEVYKDTPSQPWSLPTATQYADVALAPPTLTGATASVGAACEELRFSTSATGSPQLAYWVESGCGTADTRVHVALPSLAAGASSLYLFTGNIYAPPMSDGDAVFEFFDDFRGTTVDTSKWIQTGDASIAQDDGLLLRYVTPAWSRSLVSQQTFVRDPTRELYLALTVNSDTLGTYQDCRLGWYRNYTGASYAYISQAMNWDTETLYAIDYTTNKGTFGTISPGTEYQMRVALESAGAGYWIRGGAWENWTTVADTATYNFTPLRVGLLQYGANMDIHMVAVRTFAAVEPTVVAGATQNGSYVLPGGTWSRRQTLTVNNGGDALATYQLPLSVATDNMNMDTDRVVLTWTDTTVGETGFVIERCEGVSCTTFASLPTSLGPNATTFTDRTVLGLGHTYRYRVKAVTDLPWTETGYSNVLTATTLVPSPPTALQVTATGESSVRLAWEDHTDGETHFAVERCTVGVTCPTFTPLAATAPANAQAFVDSTVCLGGPQYTYRVFAVRGSEWTTTPTNQVTAAPLATVAAPTGLAATAVSESEISLAWTPQTVDESGFTVERCDGACVPVAVPGNGVTNFIDSGLTPATTYTYRVKAYGSGSCVWETPYSTPSVSRATLSPPPPGAFTAVSPNTTQVDLNWTDATGSETLYHVYRCEGTGCTPTAQITGAGLPANTVSYTDTAVKAATPYVYKVEAYNPAWQTSATRAVTTRAPVAPTTLAAAKVSEVEVRLTWSYTPADETGFAVERCEGSACTTFSQIALIAPGANTFTDAPATGLSAGKYWRYRVSPVKTGVTYPWNPLPYSAAANADTVPVAPSGVSAVAVGTTEVGLAWTSNTPSATGFEIWRCQGSGCSSGFTRVGTPAAAPFGDTTVAPSTVYGYQVRAVGAGWVPTECSSPTVWASTPAALSPHSLTATIFSDTSVILDWVVPTSDETGLGVDRCQTTVGSTCSSFSAYATGLAPGVETYADMGVQPSRAYCYRVRSYRTGVGVWGPLFSNSVCVDMPPAQADTPILTPLNARMIQVDWNSVATDEDGFHVEVKAWNGKFVVAGTVGPDVYTYVDTMGIEPETQYTYRVRAFRGADLAFPSGEATTVSLDLLSGDETCAP